MASQEKNSRARSGKISRPSEISRAGTNSRSSEISRLSEAARASKIPCTDDVSDTLKTSRTPKTSRTAKTADAFKASRTTKPARIPKFHRMLEISRCDLSALSLVANGGFGVSRALLRPKKLSAAGINFIFSCAEAKKGETLALSLKEEVAKGKIVALIEVADIYLPSANEIRGSIFQNARAGVSAVEGEIRLIADELKDKALQIQKIKNELQSPKISAFFTCADPIHRVHERLMRHMIDKADLTVIFLTATAKPDALPAALRKKALEYLLENFFVAQRVVLIDLSELEIFSDHDKPVLECIIAKNLGANKVVFGQKHKHIELFFDGGGMHTILDELQKRGEIEILLMPEYVYCEKCKVLVSVKNCPHGAHHHVHYRTQNLKTLLRAGILPPAIFMRKEISAMILSELFPARFENLQKLYDELFPNGGILQSHDESEFYEQLMQLYQTSALKT